MPDIWPPLRRSNEKPWVEIVAGCILAALPLATLLIILLR